MENRLIKEQEKVQEILRCHLNRFEVERVTLRVLNVKGEVHHKGWGRVVIHTSEEGQSGLRAYDFMFLSNAISLFFALRDKYHLYKLIDDTHARLTVEPDSGDDYDWEEREAEVLDRLSGIIGAYFE